VRSLPLRKGERLRDVDVLRWVRCRSILCRRRELHRAKGLEFLRQNKKTEALNEFQKCVDITPAIALQLIKVRLWALLIRVGAAQL